MEEGDPAWIGDIFLIQTIYPKEDAVMTGDVGKTGDPVILFILKRKKVLRREEDISYSYLRFY